MAMHESRSIPSPDVCRIVAKSAFRYAGGPSFFEPMSGRLLKRVCLAAMLVLAMGLARTAQAQISPGALALPHHSIDGPTNCTKCHTQSLRERSFRCTECHREIAAELAQHRGLHSTYPNAGKPGEACVKCHSDHNGENFALLHWDPTPKGFDHTKTGYMLDGKHVGVGCRQCHQA